MEIEGNKPFLSFSIDRILHGDFKTGDVQKSKNHTSVVHKTDVEQARNVHGKYDGNLFEKYAWLGFTRYNPPKLPKSNKRRIKKKRKLGRSPRVPFTPKQLTTLEGKFQKMKYLSNEDVVALCEDLGLPEHRIKIWFQNRRAREKKKPQDEYIDVTGVEK